MAIPRKACLNFHNGPLEHYRGLNIPTWVIWHNETRHSVAWHVMEKSLDSGAVVSSGSFEVASNETAYSLTLKCIDAGVRAIPDLFEKLPSLSRIEFVEGRRSADSYYAGNELPNDGVINLEWTCEKIDRLVRSLTYHPLPIHRDLPVLQTGRQAISIFSITSHTKTQKTDDVQVLQIQKQKIEIQCADAIVEFKCN